MPRRGPAGAVHRLTPLVQTLSLDEAWIDLKGTEGERVVAGVASGSVAKDSKVPAYVVFSDATLQAISEELPVDEAELLSISGIGPNKLERYGEQILEVIRSVRL